MGGRHDHGSLSLCHFTFRLVFSDLSYHSHAERNFDNSSCSLNVFLFYFLSSQDRERPELHKAPKIHTYSSLGHSIPWFDPILYQ